MKDDHYKLIGIWLLAAAVLLLWLCSCRSTRAVEHGESNTGIADIAALTSRMDSMLHVSIDWQRQIYSKQTALTDSFSNREVRDTSRVIFLGIKGDTVKEKTTIYIERNTEHSSSHREEEFFQEQSRKVDSLAHMVTKNQQLLATLLQIREKDTVVKEETMTAWEKVKWMLAGIGLSLIAVIAVVTAYMKKK